MTDDLYQILGVEPNATQGEIRKRYLFLVQAYHPDRFPEGETRLSAEAELKRINGAYAVLGDPEKRKEYDQIRGHSSSSATKENPSSEFERKFEAFKVLFDTAMSNWGSVVLTSEKDFIHRNKDLLRELVTLLIYQTNLHSGRHLLNSDELKDKFAGLLSFFVRSSIAIGAEIEAGGLPNGISQDNLPEFSLLVAHELLAGIMESCFGKGGTSSIALNDVWARTSGYFERLVTLSIAFGKELYSRQKAGHEYKHTPQPEEKRKEESGICQGCGKFAPVCKVTFNQNIGALIVRFGKEYSGNLCAECVERIYWKTTTINLFLGWWGIKSFFINIVFIFANFFNYLSTFKIRRKSDSLAGIAIGEKILVNGALLVGAFFLIRPFFYLTPNYQNNSTYSASATPYVDPIVIANQNTVFTPAPTTWFTPTMYVRIPTRTSTPYMSNCTKWSNVKSSDKGRNICVYGTVYSTVYGDDGYFYIKFSSTSNTFRMIYSKQGRGSIVTKGDCVKATGQIKSLNGMLHLYYDELYHCD